MTSPCVGSNVNSAYSLAVPVYAPQPATITKVELKTFDSVAPADAYILIKRDSGGAPTGAVIDTFTYSSMSSAIASFTGSAALSTAGTFWLVFKQVTTYNYCYLPSPTYSSLATNWTMGTTYSYQAINSSSTYTSMGGYTSYLITISGTGGVAATPSSVSLSGVSSAIYRESTLLTANLGVAGTNGLVTFYANGKKIAGCISKPSVSLSTTCSWKPSTRGSVVITARLVPTDSAYATSYSSSKNMVVGNRSTQR